MRSRIPFWILLVVVITALMGCSRRESPVSVASLRAEEDPVQESWNPRLYISENGTPRIHMTAQYMARYEREDSTYLVFSGTAGGEVRVRVYLFDEAGDSSAVVTADRLTYFGREKRFVARGNVFVLTKDSTRLESEHLAWSERDRQVTTPGFVRYVSEKDDVTGYDLVANEDLTNYRLKRGRAILTREHE